MVFLASVILAGYYAIRGWRVPPELPPSWLLQHSAWSRRSPSCSPGSRIRTWLCCSSRRRTSGCSTPAAQARFPGRWRSGAIALSLLPIAAAVLQVAGRLDLGRGAPWHLLLMVGDGQIGFLRDARPLSAGGLLVGLVALAVRPAASDRATAWPASPIAPRWRRDDDLWTHLRSRERADAISLPTHDRHRRPSDHPMTFTSKRQSDPAQATDSRWANTASTRTPSPGRCCQAAVGLPQPPGAARRDPAAAALGPRRHGVIRVQAPKLIEARRLALGAVGSPQHNAVALLHRPDRGQRRAGRPRHRRPPSPRAAGAARRATRSPRPAPSPGRGRRFRRRRPPRRPPPAAALVPARSTSRTRLAAPR